MNKLRVIDLLNKIANGKEVPKKFMFEDREFYLQSKDCWRCDDAIFEECFILEDLNKEVEIIEEDKKIEEIKIDFDEFYKHYIVTTTINEKKYNSITNSATDKIFCSKINEIIKYINKNEEEK